MYKVGEYWLKKYDWKKSGEKTLNNMGSHFKTRIDGIDVHFVRAKPDPKVAKGKKVLPLLFVHGWPGASTALHTQTTICVHIEGVIGTTL